MCRAWRVRVGCAASGLAWRLRRDALGEGALVCLELGAVARGGLARGDAPRVQLRPAGHAGLLAQQLDHDVLDLRRRGEEEVDVGEEARRRGSMLLRAEGAAWAFLELGAVPKVAEGTRGAEGARDGAEP